MPSPLEVRLKWLDESNGSITSNNQPRNTQDKSDLTHDLKKSLNNPNREHNNLSFLKYSFEKSIDSGSLSGISEHQEDRYFFASAAIVKESVSSSFRDTYFMHSQLVAVYSDPYLIYERSEFRSFLQDSSLLENENRELESFLDLVNREQGNSSPNQPTQNNTDIAMCRMRGDAVSFSEMGRTEFVLVRGAILNKPFVVIRSKIDCSSGNNCMRYEAKVKKDDLLIVGLNANFNQLSDNEITSLVAKTVKKCGGKKPSVRRMGNEFMDKAKYKGHRIDEAVTIIASWILYNI
eukprot:TRINITY_DN5051_c0_g1_i1.p1 TRINITY_DN5051_c0_g1~~TRINITY_DN5051_c0_g1_i1.p1  ORF type:complete len:292 (+),score=51.36 TRINITY_DN5051_c0_g1_i1:926-1801(+)